MKKILAIFVSVYFAFALVSSPSFAQETSSNSNDPQIVKNMLVATVNIYDATNTKINSNTYNISFRLKNKKGIQPDIRYGIQLIRKSDGVVMDMDLANEALTLGEGESKNINLNYTIPEFVPEGVYKIMIVSQTSSGIPLATSPIGFPEKLITIDGTNQGAYISNCYLTVKGDASTTAKYVINQGVDVLASEELMATCSLSNNDTSSTNNNLRLNLITHERDQYGDIVNSKILDQVISIKGNDNTVTFQIPTISRPQAYDVDTFLVDAKGEKVSPSTYIHYVTSGNSATIQNTFLDKSSYNKGESAVLKVFYSQAADTFPMSRLGGTKDSYTLNSKITNSTGQVCGQDSKSLPPVSDFGDITINIPINIDCQNAVASVEITDSKGNVLSSSTIDISNPSEKVNINPNIQKLVGGLSKINKFYVVLFVLVLVLIGYGILVFRKRGK